MIVDTIRSCFAAGVAAVSDKAEEINKLNVFPVPDGDTGTNMSLTLTTVVNELNELDASATMKDVAHAITHGSLMGARGNSGVITSQILRGVAEGLAEVEAPCITVADLASAFRNGVKVAFNAVRKPVEGTILTVIRDVSDQLNECEAQDVSLDEALDALVISAFESVARTPDLLPVLKENGVVDSGAFGIATFFEGFVNVYLGKEQTTTDAVAQIKKTASQAKGAAQAKVEIELNNDWEGSAYRYCTEFLFCADAADFDEEAALKFLASMGDCELLVGSNPDYKIHVHSNTPDKVLNYMLERGQIFEVFIHNMDLEAAERTAKIAEDKKDDTPRKELGFVAVAAGDGQAEIFDSMGVDVVVRGGQTMNPSTADLLSAIEKAHAHNVIVLPNNKNIVMAAEAAVSSADCKAMVVPSKSVLQGFSAMFVADETVSIEDNVDEMKDAIAQTRDGEVTHAVRDSQAADGSAIHTGDVIGIVAGDIVAVGSSVEDVVLSLIDGMQDEEEGDTLTILAGQDISDEDFGALCDKIEQHQPELEMDAHRGDQPLYPVIFSIE